MSFYNTFIHFFFLFLEANQSSKKKFKCDSDTERTYYKDNQQSIGITDGKNCSLTIK